MNRLILRIEEAIRVSNKIQEGYQTLGNKQMYYRQVLSTMILCLSIDKVESAQETVNCARGMDASPEFQVCMDILNASNQDEMIQAVNHPIIAYLNVQIVRSSKLLKPTGSNRMESLQDHVEEEGYL